MEEFIDAPVKTYSSGMYMRLGFAVAIHVDPDVLLVDEVLAVGDEGFTHKCLDKFAEFKRRGKTILLVTHSLGLVERFCDEALWMDGGAMKAHGRSQAGRRRLRHRRRGQRGSSSSRPATPRRRSRRPRSRRTSRPPRCCPTTRSRRATGPADMFRATEGRWGSREVEIVDVSADRPRRRARARVSQRRAARRPAAAARAGGDRGLRRRRSASSTPRASAATAPTPTSRS